MLIDVVDKKQIHSFIYKFSLRPSENIGMRPKNFQRPSINAHQTIQKNTQTLCFLMPTKPPFFVDKIPSTLPTDGQTYTSKNC